MTADHYRTPRPPAWFIILLIVIFLPAAATPWLLAEIPVDMEELKILIRLYPLYVLVADWFAYICWYPRRLMSWIMVALVIMSHIAIGTMALEVLPKL